MKQNLFNLLTNQNNLSPQQIIMNISIAAMLGVVIYISYAISHKGTIYSKKFNASLIVLTALTGTVMTVIGNNVALSLGMVGALSIVRFRTAIKDSRDTMYIFWTIVVGICCGIGDYFVAGVGSFVVFIILFIIGSIKSDNRMLLIVRANRGIETDIQSSVYKLFKNNAVLRVKNTTKESAEFIYEITAKTLSDTENKGISVTESLYRLGSVDYVNLVMQNDEVSN